jgi:hypothetical protein
MNLCITTYTGRRIDLRDPQPDQIDIVDIAHSLSMLCRFTGHTRSFFSVAQHSVWVARSVPHELRLSGLLHDAHEAYLGDWSTPLKESLSAPARAELRQFELRLIACIEKSLEVDLRAQPAIKHVDLAALATEATALMSGPIDCLPVRYERQVSPLRPWSCRAAERAFLSEYDFARWIGIRERPLRDVRNEPGCT